MKPALVSVLVLLVGCGGPASAPEEEIRRWIAEASVEAEEQRRPDLLDRIAKGYADARGNERDDIDRMLRVYFLRMRNIELLTRIDAIRVIGDTAAEVELTVGMGGRNDGVLGFSADAYVFLLELERRDGDWQLIAARWAQLGDEPR